MDIAEITITKDTWWVSLVALTIPLIFKYALEFYKTWLKNRKVQRLKRTFSYVTDIYAGLKKARQETRAVRAAVLRATNGGGIPVPGKPIYSSIVYEDEEEDMVEARSRWKKQEVDNGYAQVLTSLFEQKKILLKTEELPPSALKNLYLADGITFSKVFYIGADEKALIYVSFNFKCEEMPTTEERDLLRGIVNDFRNIFRENSDVYVVD